jgi:hypothetical protein
LTCKTFEKANPPSEGTAFLKSLGGGMMSTSIIILKINNNYNTFCHGMKLPWAYNESMNCGFNLEIPVGQTTLEVVYKSSPPIILEFFAQKNKTYIIDKDGGNSSCIKIYEKGDGGQNLKPISTCGQNITYKEDNLFNSKEFATFRIDDKFKECIHNEVLKIDNLWGDNKTGLGWGYYTYQLNTDYKIKPGVHSIQLLSGNDTIPRTISFEAKTGNHYLLDIIYNNKRWNEICTGELIIIETSDQ